MAHPSGILGFVKYGNGQSPGGAGWPACLIGRIDWHLTTNPGLFIVASKQWSNLLLLNTYWVLGSPGVGQTEQFTSFTVLSGLRISRRLHNRPLKLRYESCECEDQGGERISHSGTKHPERRCDFVCK